LPTVPTPAGAIRHAGGCLQPVLLRGRVDHIDGSTGELIHRYTTVHEPGGLLPVVCKTRRASRCAPCAEVYRADTYQLIRAGLTGGKGVPAEVAQHPCVFVTLTAPSFGAVHARRVRGDRVLACRPRRNGRTCPHGVRLYCNEKHARDDGRLGEPLCPDCYDYTGAVLFNACAPELWRRFTITFRRTLARQAGLTSKAFAAQARLSYAKVAEYQRRGVVHFHAIVRLDGPAGPASTPPADQAADQLHAGDSWRGVRDGYVFTTGWGEPVHPDTVKSLMAKLINARNKPDQGPRPKDQLPHARLHNLRHIHATTLLLSGVPVHVVAARLGHADPAITLRVYARVIRTAETAAADIFAQAVKAA
jgi:hypothetical protein